MSREAYNYKRRAKTAAKTLYPQTVVDEIENAETIAEIERIMVTARKKYL